MQEWIEIFGWMTVINIGLFAFSAAILIALKAPIAQLHAKLFEISQVELNVLYFKFLGYYKLLIILFNFVPYLALKLVSGL